VELVCPRYQEAQMSEILANPFLWVIAFVVLVTAFMAVGNARANRKRSEIAQSTARNINAQKIVELAGSARIHLGGVLDTSNKTGYDYGISGPYESCPGCWSVNISRHFHKGSRHARPVPILQFDVDEKRVHAFWGPYGEDEEAPVEQFRDFLDEVCIKLVAKIRREDT
tara:strand:+ start:425 stop:931 length:507 start_codon:yes stop_codon:yes gene_type:complete